MSRWWTVVFVPVLVVLPGCTKDKPPAPTTTTTSTTTTSAQTLGTGTVTGSSTERGLLVQVRATGEGSTEKVTFEFEGGLPGYRVGYAAGPLVEPGSGKEVAVDGDAVLEVVFERASGFDLSGGGRQVFKGPDRLDLATTRITDVVRVGDNEGTLSWAIGIRGEKAGFRVAPDPQARTITVQVAS
jgi:hypothetical protein